MRLYELASEYERLLGMAEDSSEEELRLELVGIEAAIEQKCDGIAKVLATLDADAEACAAEMKRLTAKKKRVESNAEHLRSYVLSNLAERGILKLKAGTFSFALVSNPERVVIEDASLLPDEYVRTKTSTEPDKVAILAAYKQYGECVPGTSIERTQRLQIK